jgi:SRF-type transcription factor (DNA-binding and dimerisation domain)
MGRKKISVKLIENDVLRRATFKQRLNGLLKKLHDLGVLCGVNISFLSTDTEQNIVCYSNN